MKNNKLSWRAFVAMIAGFAIFTGMSAALATPPAPDFDHPIVDESSTLTTEDIDQISKTIDNANADNRSQIAVYMTNEIPNGHSLEEASLEVAREWGVSNSGVLLYIAKDDGELRIEVAGSTSEYLTDNESKNIIKKEITPSFKEGNFVEGIDEGVAEIRAEMNGEIGESSTSSIFSIIVFVAMFLFILALIVVKSISSKFRSNENEEFDTDNRDLSARERRERRERRRDRDYYRDDSRHRNNNSFNNSRRRDGNSRGSSSSRGGSSGEW